MNLRLAKFLALLLTFCITHALNAQVNSVYPFQHDDSLLKKIWVDQVTTGKKEMLNSFDKKTAGFSDYKLIYEEKYTDIAEMLKGTRTVSDAIPHNYLQSILNKIINTNPELKNLQLRVVFTRDWWPNAYSMGDGTIAFNAGIFISLSNEAEVAFILSHELAHYYLDHSNKAIKKYVEKINSDEFKSKVKKLSKEEYRVNEKIQEVAKNLLMDTRHHSRESEAEADRYAFYFMKHSGYDCHSMITCLQLLDKIDDSLFTKPLTVQTAFNYQDYPFKQKWIQKESAIFSAVFADDSPLTKKEKDSLKTHPDCSLRIMLLQDSIKTFTGGKKFLVNEKLFKELQESFPVEIMEENYCEDNLSRNLYYALLLLQEKKHSPVAVYSIARAMNDIYELQKNHHLGEKVEKEDRALPPDYNLLLRMLDRLRLNEIAMLNYQFCLAHQSEMSSFPAFTVQLKKATLNNQ